MSNLKILIMYTCTCSSLQTIHYIWLNFDAVSSIYKNWIYWQQINVIVITINNCLIYSYDFLFLSDVDQQKSHISQCFQEYQKELDCRHDKHERLVKLSRDVTIESKRAIFLMQRSSGWGNFTQRFAIYF